MWLRCSSCIVMYSYFPADIEILSLRWRPPSVDAGKECQKPCPTSIFMDEPQFVSTITSWPNKYQLS